MGSSDRRADRVGAGSARASRLRRAVVSAAFLVIGLSPVAAGFAQDDTGGTKAEKQAPVTPKPRILTVQVLVTEPEKKQATPAANAVVRLEGSDDSFETNDKGMAKLYGVTTDKVKLQVMVIGADICRLKEVTVPTGDSVVKVLIDRSGAARCKLLD